MIRGLSHSVSLHRRRLLALIGSYSILPADTSNSQEKSGNEAREKCYVELKGADPWGGLVIANKSSEKDPDTRHVFKIVANNNLDKSALTAAAAIVIRGDTERFAYVSFKFDIPNADASLLRNSKISIELNDRTIIKEGTELKEFGRIDFDEKAEELISLERLIRSGGTVAASLELRGIGTFKKEVSFIGFKTIIENGKSEISRIQNSGDIEKCSRDCFMTTACCDVVGLPDNSWELRTLRHFRDHRLPRLQHGEADIASYYAQAPSIVAAIQTRPNGRHELLKLYRSYVLPAAVFAALGFDGWARARYRAMMLMMNHLYVTGASLPTGTR